MKVKPTFTPSNYPASLLYAGYTSKELRSELDKFDINQLRLMNEGISAWKLPDEMTVIEARDEITRKALAICNRGWIFSPLKCNEATHK